MTFFLKGLFPTEMIWYTHLHSFNSCSDIHSIERIDSESEQIYFLIDVGYEINKCLLPSILYSIEL